MYRGVPLFRGGLVFKAHLRYDTRHIRDEKPKKIGVKYRFLDEEGAMYSGVPWFRGGLVFEAHRFFVSLNSRLESDKEEEKSALPAHRRSFLL